MAKKKYSYNDRVEYHSQRMKSFTDKFQKEYAYGSDIDFDALDKAEAKQPKIQYSDGYSNSAADLSRGHYESEEKLKKKSAAYQRGYKAAVSAFEKSRNIKF